MQLPGERAWFGRVLEEQAGVGGQGERGQVLGGHRRGGVEPAGAGTRLTASGEAEATGLSKLLAPILVRTLKRHSQDDLANVKRILEASAAASY